MPENPARAPGTAAIAGPLRTPEPPSPATAAFGAYAGVLATSEFSLSIPNLLPRLRRLGDLPSFTFLTARLLEPTRDPDEMFPELVAFVGLGDSPGRAALIGLPL